MTSTMMKFFAQYPMFGDVEPEAWINAVLEEAKKGELIFDYKFIHVFDGVVTQDIYFEFTTTVEIPGEDDNSTWLRQLNAAKKQATEIANKIVGDSDCEILSANVV